MGKSKETPTQAPHAGPLSAAAADAARKLLGNASNTGSAVEAHGSPHQDMPEMAVLKERCAAFGIHASSEELLLAGLHLLTQQTETGLEVAVLQSLRADRTYVPRRHRRG